MQTPSVPHWSNPWSLLQTAAAFHPHLEPGAPQLHLPWVARDVDRAPFDNNEGLIEQGQPLAPLDVGEGKG